MYPPVLFKFHVYAYRPSAGMEKNKQGLLVRKGEDKDKSEGGKQGVR